MALVLEGCGGQNDPLPISTPSHSSRLNVALHSRCFHRGGRAGGGSGEGKGGKRRRGRRGRRDGGLRGREVVFLFSLAQREGKTIGVQMVASPLFLDDPPPPSFRLLPPSLLSGVSACVEKNSTDEKMAVG